MLVYTLSKQVQRVLVVDLDPQANTTDLLFTTMKQVLGVKPVFNKMLEVVLKNGNLTEVIVHVKDQLDLLPSNEDL